MEEYKKRVFLDIYRMCYKPVQDWEVLYSKHTGELSEHFLKSVEMLKNEGFIELPDESVVYEERDGRLSDVALDDVRITEKGYDYAKRLSM